MKKLNIETPEGYEIDNEKSDLSEGIVRFKQVNDNLTYEDVCKKLIPIGSLYKYIDIYEIIDAETALYEDYKEWIGNEAKTKEQLEALLALNKLKNVANYLNGDWKPDWDNFTANKHYIILSKEDIEFHAARTVTSGEVVFKSRESAQQAIGILGEDTVKLALSFGSL